jgi:hypothetical protein
MMTIPAMRIVFYAWLIACTLSTGAWAQTTPSSPATTADLTSSDGINCSDYNVNKGALLAVIVPCIKETVQIAGARVAGDMAYFMQPVMWAFITLAMVFFGIKIVTGEGEVEKKGILFIFKIGLIVYFASEDQLVDMFRWVFDIMQQGQDILAGAIMPNGTAPGNILISPDSCVPENQYSLWVHFDCMLGKIMGFTFGTGSQPSMVLITSMLGMLGGFFFGGTFGFALFFAMIGFIVGLFAFVFRSALVFVTGYLTVAIYIIIAPIFIPLALLQITFPYFERWLKAIIAGAFVPIIVSAYAIIALNIFDAMLFRDDSLVKQIFNYQVIKDAQRECKEVTLGEALNDSAGMATKMGLSNTELAGASSNQTRTIPAFGMDGRKTCMPHLEVMRSRLGGDPNANPTGDYGKETFQNMMIELMQLFVLAMVVNAGWSSVMGFLNVLGGSSAVAAAASQPSKQEQQISQMAQSARGVAEQRMGGASGAEFIENLGPSITDGFKQFLSGASR